MNNMITIDYEEDDQYRKWLVAPREDEHHVHEEDNQHR